MEYSEPTLAIDRDCYRKEAVKWMAEFGPTHFVTFVFNRTVTAITAERDLNTFRLFLFRKITGKRCDPGDNLRYIASIEHERSNLHIHALFRVPAEWRERFELHAPIVWGKLGQAGNVEIKPVQDAVGAARYITKEMRPSESYRLLV